jgi:hypothetical protein
MTFVLLLLKEHRPLRFFGVLSAVSAIGALIAAAFRSTMPTWAAKPGIGLTFVTLAVIFMVAAIVLDSLSRARREVKRMVYLATSNQVEHPRPTLRAESVVPS